ncbi:MAG TPA: TetR family transcriptional regulator [Elusimicrobia bacterium]|nr:TetR family transcriptional regulator [Elusimicrobiota bacterium]
MSRPAGDADRKLLSAGRELLARKGISGLSVREVASKAEVNLGMFHYHFKTKDEFARRVLQEIYEEFFAKLSLEASEGTSAERLRKALTSLARFARDNRALVLCLGQDAVAGNRPAIEFLLKNAPRHVRIVMGLVRDCQKAGVLRRSPLTRVMVFLGGGVMLPAVLVAALERVLSGGIGALPFKLVVREILSDEAIADRVDMAMKGASA